MQVKAVVQWAVHTGAGLVRAVGARGCRTRDHQIKDNVATGGPVYGIHTVPPPVYTGLFASVFGYLPLYLAILPFIWPFCRYTGHFAVILAI